MKELIAEYDCFISAESSNNLQLINHNRIQNYDDCRILNASYKHKIPELQMTVNHVAYNEQCKVSSENTETKILTEVNDVNKSKSNFVVYFSGSDAYFVPLSRPILTSYIANDYPPEYKKIKEKSKQEYNPINEMKQSLEIFHEIPKEKTFKFLSNEEKIRQPWLPVHFRSLNNNTVDSTLICYQRDELRHLRNPENPIASLLESTGQSICPALSVAPAPTVSCLESEISKILIETHVIQFNRLINWLKDRNKVDRSQLTTSNVLEILPKFALVLRGHWVIKSEVLYKICPCDPAIPMEKLCLARDYILCAFYKEENVTTKTVQSLTKIPSVTANDLLDRLCTRSNESKGGMWKFPPHDYDFILKNGEINKQQIRIMDQKVEDVESKLKIQKPVHNHEINPNKKRQRTLSKQIEDFDHIKQLNEVSPVKRSRQNSTPAITNQCFLSKSTDVDMGQIVEETPIPEMFTPAIQNNTTYDEEEQLREEYEYDVSQNIKAEPYSTPPVSHNDIEQDENIPYIKAERSEYFSEEEEEEEPQPLPPQNVIRNPVTSSTVQDCPPGFPSIIVFDNLKEFVKLRLESTDILPVTNLSLTYHKDHLSQINFSDLGNWIDLSHSLLLENIATCVMKILDEWSAQKIEIAWPSIEGGLTEQPLYFSNRDSLLKDQPILDSVVFLLQTEGHFTFSRIKKELAKKSESKAIASPDNLLRDKLLKYCELTKRKYFLKHTVAGKK